MAFGALRSTLRRDHAPADSADGPIEFAPAPADWTADGGIDAVVFSCPSCGRTIARGSHQCSGCGQRLLLDVPLGRASGLAGGGVVAGVLVTLLVVTLLAPAARPSTAADDARTGQGAGAADVAAALAVPAGAVAALRGTTAINGRLVGEADDLAAALAAKSLKTGDVVKVLRRMNIDTRAGAGMVRALDGWPEAVGQQAALGAFYDDLAARIEDGLAASMHSTAAYRKSAASILETLGQVAPLDAGARTLAAQAGLDLAPVTIPEAAR